MHVSECLAGCREVRYRVNDVSAAEGGDQGNCGRKIMKIFTHKQFPFAFSRSSAALHFFPSLTVADSLPPSSPWERIMLCTSIIITL